MNDNAPVALPGAVAVSAVQRSSQHDCIASVCLDVWIVQSALLPADMCAAQQLLGGARNPLWVPTFWQLAQPPTALLTRH